ncbi:MAG TPA: HAD-IIA family hydrolase, partial [Candidatus Micrarchaeota archaeon]|nr:HAD-IIA family hydrolase [Candidatus Micrarchaeota archaeon]
DGVVHRGDKPILGSAQAIAALEKAGIGVFFMTNNSSRSRDDYSRKLSGFGINAPKGKIYTSALGAARWAAGKGVKKSYVVGEAGLEAELVAQGIAIARDENAGAVIVGLDRDITYGKIDIAMQAITRHGALFIATNPDAIYPRENDFGPGAGAMVAAVQAACGKKPDYVAGKPTVHLIGQLLSDAKIKPGEAVFVGDRLDTDIRCAKKAGVESILVLTGVSSRADAAGAKKSDKPGLVLESIADITPKLLASF